MYFLEQRADSLPLLPLAAKHYGKLRSAQEVLQIENNSIFCVFLIHLFFLVLLYR